MSKYMKKKQKASWQKRALSCLCVILGLVLAIMVAGTVYYESLLNKINRPGDQGSLTLEELEQLLQEDIEEATGEAVDDNVQIDDAQQIFTGADTVNIMLVGQDARPGEKRSRSDTMILCTIKKDQGKVILTSFLRDTYVKIPGVRKAKMNTAYAYGGMDLLADTMLENFGIKVDNTVEVSFTGFMDVIDTIGGVEIELTEAEAGWMNSHGSGDVGNERGWKLKAGKNLLDGNQALAYARIRKIDSDFSRTNRQRTILTSLLNQSRGMSLTRMHALLDTFLPLITTNMTDAQIVQYALELFPLLKDLTIESGSIPSRDNYVSAYISGRYVLIPDLEEARQRLKAIMGEDS